MELTPQLKKPLETIRTVGMNALRFVQYRLDGGHGGFAELADVCYPASITIFEGDHDES